MRVWILFFLYGYVNCIILFSGLFFKVFGLWSLEGLVLSFKDDGRIIEYLLNFKLKDFYRFNMLDLCW